MKSIAGIAVLLGFSVMILQGCGKQNNAAKQTGSSSKITQEIASKKTAEKSNQQVCAAHNAPKEKCFICDPSLREKRLWCKEHARYEDRCWLCYPELEDKARLYCKEHGLYEDECFICHPDISTNQTKKDISTSALSGLAKANDLMCIEHNLLESECALCHHDLLAQKGAGEGMKLRLKSKESSKMAGIEISRTIANGKEGGRQYACVISYNENRLAKTIAPFAGTIKRVIADAGKNVKAGEVLLEMDAGEIAQLHAEFLKLKNELTLKKNIFTRESELFKANVSSRQELELSESEFRSAQSSYAALRQRLLSNGIAPDDFDMYSSSASALSVLRMRAPFTGTVVDRQATIGQYVDTHTPLMTVADLSKMWAEISLPADAAGSLSIGDSVQVEVDVAAGSGYSGSITWISTAVDPTSRTIKARAEITNDDGKLRSGVFAKARLLKADVAKGFLVSADAVQRIDKKDYVFVASPDDDLFEVRSVNIGMRQGEFIQVVSGLSGSEAVVSTGAFSLKSELLRSKFGAGCCEPLE